MKRNINTSVSEIYFLPVKNAAMSKGACKLFWNPRRRNCWVKKKTYKKVGGKKKAEAINMAATVNAEESAAGLEAALIPIDEAEMVDVTGQTDID